MLKKDIVSMLLCLLAMCGECVAKAAAPMPLVTPPAEGASLSPSGAPPVSVVDLVRMRTFAERWLGEPQQVAWSPDQSHFAFVVCHGDPEHNTRVYELLVFSADEILGNPQPHVVARFASSANRPGITAVRWLADNKSLTFLAENPGETPQVYAVDIQGRQVLQLTHAASTIRHYNTDAAGKRVVYVADKMPQPDNRTRARGFVLTQDAYLPALIDPRLQAYNQMTYGLDPWETILAFEPLFVPLEVWVQEGAAASHRLTLPGVGQGLVQPSVMNLRLSPDGEHLLLPYRPQVPPESWRHYQKDKIGARWADPIEEWRQWVIVNVRSGAARALMGTPIALRPDMSPGEPLLWSADGRSVIFGGALLSLDDVDAKTHLERSGQRFIASVEIVSGAVTAIARDSVAAPAIVRWMPGGALLQIKSGEEMHYFSKSARGWQATEAPEPLRMSLEFDESPNSPRTLVAVDPISRQRHLVYDPDPGLLKRHRFGRVVQLRWSYGRGGQHDDGMLYWPPDYVPGRRYPLVIQGHGKTSTDFWPNGHSTTKHAAQPLANAGFMVAQISEGGEDWDQLDFTTYPSTLFAQIEGLIDQLDKSGLVDRTRVGLSGFSTDHGAFMHFMAHSRYPIVAATLAEGVEFSYFNYLTNMGHPWQSAWEKANGGLIWSDARDKWLDRAPGFRLDRISAAIQFEASGDGLNIFTLWEGYQGLRRLGRPVELIMQPEATHVRQKPWDRITSQQGAVDWFRFWIQGHEREEPIVAIGETAEELSQKYARWRAMRKDGTSS